MIEGQKLIQLGGLIMLARRVGDMNLPVVLQQCACLRYGRRWADPHCGHRFELREDLFHHFQLQ